MDKARMDKWLTRESADVDPEQPEADEPESVIGLLHDILDGVTAVRQELEALRQRSESVYLRNDVGHGFGGDF